MKKSVYAILVLLFSIVGAHAVSEKLDMNVKKVAVESQDKTGSDNEKTGGACRSKVGQ